MIRRRWLVAAGVWLSVSLVLLISRAEPSVVALGSIVALIAAVAFGASDLAQSVLPVHWRDRVVLGLSPGDATGRSRLRRKRATDSADDRSQKLRQRAFAAARSDSTSLHLSLVELVDDRLLALHHIDRQRDPEAAADVLGPALTRLVAGPERRIADAPVLAGILTEIEAL